MCPDVRSFGTPLNGVEWAADGAATVALQDVGVDHRRFHIRVTEELLDGANVVVVFQKVRGEGVAQAMTACVFFDACRTHGFFHGALHGGLVEMMPAFDAAAGIDRKARGREEILPGDLA